jgi:uncharacterized membrane protein
VKTVIGEAVKNGLIGGVLSGIISALLNYYLLPFPNTAFDNAMGHGFGGFFCGLISCVIGILIYASQHNAQKSQEVLSRTG